MIFLLYCKKAICPKYILFFINKQGWMTFCCQISFEGQNILRTYGLFAIEEKDHKDELQKLISLSDETQKKGKIQEKTIVWENQEIKIKIVPLLYQKNIVGVLILGKSLSDLAEFKSVVLITFFVMTATSLIGSLLLGNFLSNMAFRPIVKIQH